jgi:hypothetical protein
MPKLITVQSLVMAASFCLVASAATVARAQTSASSESSAAASSAPANTPSATAGVSSSAATAKKVWTNEDVTNLQDESISTIGKSGAKPVKTDAGSKPVPAPRNGQQLLNEITRLKGQVTEFDAQIARLQAAMSGQATGDSKSSTRPFGVKGNSFQTELDDVQKKRADTLTHISDLEDQARHNGVPANSIP